ncbi:MAG: Ryanodine receptor Ryr [Prevotella sp.]|nr:Ryanodine receptor Ryr [Prevotella sp.]
MEKENMYTPKPIDTSDIILPENLTELAEQLAKNVHEVWSQTRMEQGWTYGEKRDDQQLKHPCLIPYEELPESEKLYDRNTSQQTLKLIIKLGFRIVREE